MLKKGLIGVIGLAFIIGVSLSARAFEKDEFTRKWECVSHLQDQGYSFPDAYRKCVIMLEREKASKATRTGNPLSHNYTPKTKTVPEEQPSSQDRSQPLGDDPDSLPPGL